MHDIEPHYKWRTEYIASEDERSPFYGREYSEFTFPNQIYNYLIHPQWDEFGSPTLYMKILFVDYEEGFAVIELLGEWNDCIQNDVMYLKRNIADHLIEQSIHKFIIICENVLNFHGEDDDYYEEWYQDIADDEGWVVLINTLEHVSVEMMDTRLQAYVHFGPDYNDLIWRPLEPLHLCRKMDRLILDKRSVKHLD